MANRKIIIKPADKPGHRAEMVVYPGKVIVQLIRSESMFGTKVNNIFYKGREVKCEYKFIGSRYGIASRKIVVKLDADGCFSIHIDREMLGATLEFKILDFGHVLNLQLRTGDDIPRITSLCWSNTEQLTNDIQTAKSRERTGSIYPNEDAFLHVTTHGMFGQMLVAYVVDKEGKELASTVLIVKKNCGLAVFSMEEIKRAFQRFYPDKKTMNAEFYVRIESVERYKTAALTLVMDGTKAPVPAKASPQLGTAKAVVGKGEMPTKKIIEKENLKIALFFDGTCNNKDNVEAREAYERIQKQKGGGGDATKAKVYEKQKGENSYENDKSNVAKLWDAYNVGSKRIYVEGIATTTYKGDTTYAAATGMGDTGIVAKVEAGISKIVGKLIESSQKRLESLVIDVYGFSRGAAASRHFVAEVTQNGVLGRTEPYGKLGKAFKENDIVVKRLMIRFTGLFDTVSSYGVNHSDDVGELQLHKVAKSRRVVQLAAADEYRANFALTRIGSCGSRGLELFLPGAHADIGGGYREDDKAEHAKPILSIAGESLVKRTETQLLDEGWYETGQLEQNRTLVMMPYQTVRPLNGPDYYYTYALKGKRTVSNLYAHIPLHIMKNLMVKNTGDDTFKSDFSQECKIDDKLSDIHQCLQNYVNDARRGPDIKAYERYFVDEKEKPLLKKLRNKHLHWSAEPGIVNGANIENETFIRKRHEDN